MTKVEEVEEEEVEETTAGTLRRQSGHGLCSEDTVLSNEWPSWASCFKSKAHLKRPFKF